LQTEPTLSLCTVLFQLNTPDPAELPLVNMTGITLSLMPIQG